jgi:small conductance mechanosensitive channel
MKIENKKSRIKYYLLVLGIFLGMVVPAAAEEAQSAETTTEASKINPQHILDALIQFLATKGTDFALNLLAAILILVIGRWISKLISKIIAQVMTKAKVERLLVTFVQHMSYFALLAFVIIAALDRIGVKLTAAIAVLGAAALAIAFALQGSLSNFAAGILMIIFKPFKVGDFIEVSGAQGIVQEIQVLTTVINSLDNVRIIIPNAQVTSGTIRNFTANDTRRIDLTIGVSYDDDLKKAKEVIENVLRADPRILKNPAPTVAVSKLSDSSVDFAVRPWVKPADYWDVYFDVTEKLKLAIESNGLTIPFTQYDVNIKGKTA